MEQEFRGPGLQDLQKTQTLKLKLVNLYLMRSDENQEVYPWLNYGSGAPSRILREATANLKGDEFMHQIFAIHKSDDIHSLTN